MSKNPNDPTTDPAPDPAPDETPAEKPITVTVDDHEYTVEPVALDDFELLDDLAELERTDDPGRAPSVLRRLLGTQQARVALERLRDEKTGRVPVTAGTDFVIKLLDGLDPN